MAYRGEVSPPFLWEKTDFILFRKSESTRSARLVTKNAVKSRDVALGRLRELTLKGPLASPTSTFRKCTRLELMICPLLKKHGNYCEFYPTRLITHLYLNVLSGVDLQQSLLSFAF